MRLIDADALKRYIPTRMDMQDLYLPVHFKTLIDEQPTVDAVPVGFIEALHTYYVRRSKALQGRIGHMYTLYALALEKLVQSFNYVNAMDDEMKTERNCADGERR